MNLLDNPGFDTGTRRWRTWGMNPTTPVSDPCDEWRPLGELTKRLIATLGDLRRTIPESDPCDDWGDHFGWSWLGLDPWSGIDRGWSKGAILAVSGGIGTAYGLTQRIMREHGRDPLIIDESHLLPGEIIRREKLVEPFVPAYEIIEKPRYHPVSPKQSRFGERYPRHSGGKKGKRR